MRSEKIEIEGMHCGGCVKRVTQALSKLAGVTIKKVEIGLAEILVDEGVNQAQLVTAVATAGYRVTGVRSGLGEEG